MAITTRNYTLSSTSTVSNLSWSSINMPQGMTSSISSDGTTFLLNWDDSQISAIGSGTLTMIANWNDDDGNQRSASTSINWQIINTVTYITYELNEIQNHLAELTGQFITKIVFSDNFSFNNISAHIDKKMNFTNNSYIAVQQFDYHDEAAPGIFEIYINSSVVHDLINEVEVGTQTHIEWADDFIDNYGNWSKNNKTWNWSADANNLLIIKGFNWNNTNFDKVGTIELTFGKVESSFAIQME